MRKVFLIVVCLILAVTDIKAEQAPVLRYTPPPNTFRQGLATPEDYTFNGFNASVQFYPFRPFTGNIVQTFEMTLLRDWISPLHQEVMVGGRPQFQQIKVPGAQIAIAATFNEIIVGPAKVHNRLLIVVGNMAAIVDASAPPQSWALAARALGQMATTLHVETLAVRISPPLTDAAGRAVAGLYMAMKQKFTSGLYGLSASHYTSALHYYLFSADGRVYRHYDQLPVPNGDIALFDFDSAARTDPDNSGHYNVDGGKLIIQMGGANPETIVAVVPQNGSVNISNVVYKKQ